MKRLLLLLLFFLICLPFSDAAESPAAVFFEQGKLVVRAENALLADVLDGVRRECWLEIAGLEHREAESITFSAEGETPEDLLKRLFRYLGEENHVFEFSDVRLTRVLVFPSSKKGRTVSSAPERKKEALEPKAFVSVVEIKGIEKGTQAEELDLQAGDFVTEYNGVEVTNARDMVKEVKKTSESDIVGMTVIRDRQPMQISLSGGLIGIRIVTRRLAKSELDF